jgi:hypothetical protein
MAVAPVCRISASNTVSAGPNHRIASSIRLFIRAGLGGKAKSAQRYK